MNDKELFENNCFPLFWSEDDEILEQKLQPRKDLSVLMAELEEIKNKIDDIATREWELGKLIEYNKMGFTAKDLG